MPRPRSPLTGIDQADGAIQSRITEGLAALLAFADHPLVGVGPGEFPGVYRDYAEMSGSGSSRRDRQAHNLFLGMAAELGLAGIIVFFAIIYLTLRDLARARRMTRDLDPMMSALATGFLLAIVTYLTTGLFLHMSFVRYFWLLLGLAGAAAVVGMAIGRGDVSAGAVAPAAEADATPAPVGLAAPGGVGVSAAPAEA